MKLIKSFITLFAVMALMPVYVFAQNINNDLKNINKAYLDHNNMHLVMRVSAFRSWTDKNPYEQKEGTIIKGGVRKYTSIGEMTMILNTDYSFTVDHESKKILLLPASVKSRESANDLLMPRFDSVLLKICRKTEFIKESESSHSYEFTLNEGNEYEKVRISFSPKTYLINKITFYYSEQQEAGGSGVKKKPRLEISYVKTEFPARVAEQEFTYTKYLVSDNGKLICRQQYKNYQLINQLPKK